LCGGCFGGRGRFFPFHPLTSPIFHPPKKTKPKTGCADWLDIGEAAYATPLADDLDGDGEVEVLLASMSGGVHAIRTGAGLASFAGSLPVREAVPGGNCFVSRPGYEGIAADPASRAPRDVRGRDFTVRFDVVDTRPNGTMMTGAQGGGGGASRGPYRVSVTLSGVGHAAMGQGPAPIVGMADTVPVPGSYALTLPAPRTRSTAVVQLEMVDEVRLKKVEKWGQKRGMDAVFPPLFRGILSFRRPTHSCIHLSQKKKKPKSKHQKHSPACASPTRSRSPSTSTPPAR
jgi:hypothetical protein